MCDVDEILGPDVRQGNAQGDVDADQLVFSELGKYNDWDWDSDV